MWTPPWVPHLLGQGLSPAPTSKRRCGTTSLLEPIAQPGSLFFGSFFFLCHSRAKRKPPLPCRRESRSFPGLLSSSLCHPERSQGISAKRFPFLPRPSFHGRAAPPPPPPRAAAPPPPLHPPTTPPPPPLPL